MFFSYPKAATNENWLHEFLVTTIETIHKNAESRQRLLKWPDCIPAKHKNVLEHRRSLRDHFKTYERAMRKLNQPERDKVLECLRAQNKIEDLLAAKSDCGKLQDLHKAIQKPVKDLFNCAFDLLTPLGIRDRQYEIIFEAAENQICPFCFCEEFDAPKTKRYALDDNGKQIREALDHYLPRDKYPFAAANLRNLAPMGGRCNHYKLDADILRKTDGIRRRVFFPYSGDGVQVSLKKSAPFSGRDNLTPAWSIDFVPSSPEAETWDSVFTLKKRLCRNVLNPRYNGWFKDFCRWFAKNGPNMTPTNAEIVDGLKEHYTQLVELRALKGREHFRGLVLLMLHHHCSRGDSRLLNYIKASLKDAVPPPSPTSY